MGWLMKANNLFCSFVWRTNFVLSKFPISFFFS